MVWDCFVHQRATSAFVLIIFSWNWSRQYFLILYITLYITSNYSRSTVWNCLWYISRVIVRESKTRNPMTEISKWLISDFIVKKSEKSKFSYFLWGCLEWSILNGIWTRSSVILGHHWIFEKLQKLLFIFVSKQHIKKFSKILIFWIS